MTYIEPSRKVPVTYFLCKVRKRPFLLNIIFFLLTMFYESKFCLGTHKIYDGLK